jgi:HAD superfamily hydrolase (TIGR01509 family)
MPIRVACMNAVVIAQTSAKFVSKNNLDEIAIAWDDIDTVILDMDGTLLDLNFDREVWNRLLPERLSELSGCSLDAAEIEVDRRLGSARGTLQWYSLDHWHERLGVNIADLEKELEHLVQIRPGALEFLEALSESRYRVVLATNAQRSSMRRKLELTGIERFFDDIACAHDFGNCKEEISFWRSFTNALSIDPTRSLFIDDNQNVLETASQFGLAYVYGIRYPSTKGTSIDDPRFRCLTSFDELSFASNVNSLGEH